MFNFYVNYHNSNELRVCHYAFALSLQFTPIVIRSLQSAVRSLDSSLTAYRLFYLQLTFLIL